MTLFWLWVSAACAASALLGFAAVRVGARALWTDVGEAQPVVVRSPSPPLPSQRPAPARARASRPRAAAASRPSPAPSPTAPRPDAEKLALWARQVKAGERKMSLATDGCRVTWDRRCKHGHPTWLVELGYLTRRPPPAPRHNPR